MNRLVLKFIFIAGMLLGLPLAGVGLKGGVPECYLEFPPRTQYIDHAPFSWPAFIGYSSFIFLIIIPLIIVGTRSARQIQKKPITPYRFPWWGWVGITTGFLAWVLAWSRFPWFEIFQPHTFTPLWFSFILVINALTHRRKGNCIMLDRPVYFLSLFPASAVFWWFFEYMNRFVQNWYYVGVQYSPWEYFCYATLSFSTVLPAVLSVYKWIRTYSWLEYGFKGFSNLHFMQSHRLAGIVLFFSAAGLALVGIWPNYLFALLWVSPLLIILSLQVLTGDSVFIKDISRGDWRRAVSFALAALFCGCFWEMWNYFSLAKWEYSIPYVHGFRIFEMPVLGYAGYLPFGLECLVILEILGSLKCFPAARKKSG